MQSNDTKGVLFNQQPEKLAKGHHPLTSQDKFRVDNSFHVFTWLNELPPTLGSTEKSASELDDGQPNFDEKGIEADLLESESFLEQMKFEQRPTFDEIPQRTRREVYNMLKSYKQRLLQVEEAAGESEIHQEIRKFGNPTRAIFEAKVEILNKAETLFRFFLPSHYEAPTVGKFWGGLCHLFEVSSLSFT